MSNERQTALIAGVAGLLGVVGNVGGVLFLGDMGSAYRVARLSEWVAAVVAQPWASTGSALAFTLGLVFMAGWAWHLGRAINSPLARAGAALIAVFSLFNAAGTMTPIVHAFHVGACGVACDAAGRALLGLSLALDALFNLGLGLGLLLCAIGASGGGWTRWLMAVAGLAALPVAGQAIWDPAANMLAIAAPLWLALMIKTSVVWMRSNARSAY